MEESKFIAAIDVGTTTLRCHILNSEAHVISSYSSKIKLLYPQPGYVEICPNQLWESVIFVIKQAVANANLTFEQIKSLGIATQRGTFITWRKNDGKPFHNFITWKDLRADALVRKWNKSVSMKTFRNGSYFIYLFSRNKRYLTGSGVKLTNIHVSVRLYWALQNIPELRQAISDKNAMYGTLDSWLLYQFTKGRLHITDITNASATGFYDPFVLKWASWAVFLFGIPQEILPEVVDNDFAFGTTDPEIFGSPIPIQCVISDQSASMFGSCCFDYGSIKATLGTGCFLDVNTGTNVHSGIDGLYPLVGWKLKNEVAFLTEASANDSGSLIEWALNAGLVENPADTSNIASIPKDNDGLYFIPAFSGLGAPINDENAASGFIGLKPTSKREHMIRAILESIVYRISLIYNILKKETNMEFKKLCVDGGVSQNDFICQKLADITGLQVERPSSTEMSVMGVAYLTGIHCGFWTSKTEVRGLRVIDKIFEPSKNEKVLQKCGSELREWLQAAERFKSWYLK